MTVFILASGEGRRLLPITKKWPKPAIPLLNVPLIYYPLYHFLKLGLNEVIINLHHLPQKIQLSMEPLKDKLSITYSDESVRLLGSGGAIWKARHLLSSQDGFALVNGDEVLLPKDMGFLKKAIQQHKDQNALSTLVTIDHEGLGKKFGAVWCDEKRVLGFGREAPRPSLVARHYTGFQILSSRIFDTCLKAQAIFFMMLWP